MKNQKSKVKTNKKSKGLSLLRKKIIKIKEKFINQPKKKLLLVGVGCFLILIWLFWDLPWPGKLSSHPFPASTLIYDRGGNLLYEIYAEKNRVPVKLSELPPYIKWATIASEDKNFYRHHGFDFGGILRASYNIVFRRTLQGGSTITQQLVKNALLEDPRRTLRRKIREAVLTLATEAIYSKDEILEMYLNQVPYGLSLIHI